MFVVLAGGYRSRVTVILRKKFPTPTNAMAQKESGLAVTDATLDVPTDVHDDHSTDVLREGIDALAISYVRT